MRKNRPPCGYWRARSWAPIKSQKIESIKTTGHRKGEGEGRDEAGIVTGKREGWEGKKRQR